MANDIKKTDGDCEDHRGKKKLREVVRHGDECGAGYSAAAVSK